MQITQTRKGVWNNIVEQSTHNGLTGEEGGQSKDGAMQRVYRGILQALELHQLVPGQRLIETDLAAQFGVGRNAVREAMQRLAARGIVDLSRHRSAAIRQLDLDETMEVLDVTTALTGLMVRSAARHYRPELHSDILREAVAHLEDVEDAGHPGAFSKARRGFYRTLLAIAGNRELRRVFPAVGMHVIYSHYQSPRLRRLRIEDYKLIMAAVASGDEARAEAVGRAHVDNVRAGILELARG